MSTDTYPVREKHFAHRFCRLVMKSCVATEHGQDVALLLIGIAMTEDSRRYRGAVTYFNEQLAPVLGFANVKALQRAREEAVKAGWLHYEPGARHRPAKYWVTIPSEFAGDDGGEMGCEQDELKTDTRQKTTTNMSSVCPQSVLSSSSVCPTIVPSPVPGPNTREKESEQAKQHVANWPMPTNASEPRHRIALAKWQEVRKRTHGHYLDEIAWQATVITNQSLSPDAWHAALMRSVQHSAKSLCVQDFNAKSKPANAPKEVIYNELTAPTREPTR